MYKILCLNKISETGLAELPTDQYDILSEEQSPDGILLRSFEMNGMALPDNLKAVARAGAGVNNVPVDACSEKGIVVFNTPGANANAVKELVIAGLLVSSRKIVDGINWVQGLNGQTGIAKLVEKGKAEFVGPEILGKKLGVVGLGAIGVLIANACCALGMDVYGYDPYTTINAAWNLNSAVRKTKSLDTILAECDYITIHVPLNADTKEMFNEAAFAKAQKGVRILNFARAELVSTAAIKKAIDDGIVSCYVTDFPTDDVLGNKNIITVPHLGASTPESEDNCARMAAAQMREYLEFGHIKNSVNFPSCHLDYTSGKRYCIIHKNVHSVLSGITNVFAEKNINIENMVNKSKKEVAYTVVDVDQNDNVLDELNKLDGIINVRVIG